MLLESWNVIPLFRKQVSRFCKLPQVYQDNLKEYQPRKYEVPGLCEKGDLCELPVLRNDGYAEQVWAPCAKKITIENENLESCDLTNFHMA